MTLAGLLAAAALAAEPVVRLSSAPAALELAPGSTAELRLGFEVREGFHIQSNPAADRFLVPAELRLSSAPGLAAGRPAYPEPKSFALEDSTRLLVYDGSFAVSIPVAARRNAKPGQRLLRGSLRYQACDDRRCLFPEKLPVAVTVRVLPGAPRR